MKKTTGSFHRWSYADLLASRENPRKEWENCELIQDHCKLGSHLCKAILRGDNREAAYLLKSGAPVNHQDHPDGWTPLIFSIYYDNPVGRELLISNGADIFIPDFSGRNVLMFAALTGDPELTAELLKRGLLPEIKDNLGRTALDFALLSRNMRCIELLKK